MGVTASADKAQDVRNKGHGHGAELQDAQCVRWCAQLEVALGPALEQQHDDVKEHQARVSAHAAKGKAASELAVRSHGTDAAGTRGCARDAELDVARRYSGEGGEEGERSAPVVSLTRKIIKAGAQTCRWLS
jgi:hypothetical protein